MTINSENHLHTQTQASLRFYDFRQILQITTTRVPKVLLDRELDLGTATQAPVGLAAFVFLSSLFYFPDNRWLLASDDLGGRGLSFCVLSVCLLFALLMIWDLIPDVLRTLITLLKLLFFLISMWALHCAWVIYLLISKGISVWIILIWEGSKILYRATNIYMPLTSRQSKYNPYRRRAEASL